MTRTAHGLLIAALAWGAFAFGAVYPWAWWPLVVALQAVAWIGILVRAPGPESLRLTAVWVALALAVVAALAQLVPLPLSLVRTVSPAAMDSIGQLDILAGAGLLTRHPLSIQPAATLAGIAVCGSLALLIVGTARLLSMRGVRPTIEAITIVGVLLALTGIIQQPLYSGRIYGFWTSQMGGSPFGPFVNKNHFAGWMLMALPLTLGLICSSVAHGMHGVKSGFRERMLWFASPDANRLLLVCAAAAVMALALVMTMSRSGVCAFVLAIAITSIQVLRRQKTTARKIVAMVILLCIAGGVVAWIGAGTIATRFADANWAELNNRKDAWDDAIEIARRFPLTGTGLNTYGVATLFYQTHDLSNHYAQAHNDYLQLAAEGGVLLVVPVLACVVVFIRAVRRRFREGTGVTAYWIRVGAVTGLAAIALQEIVEFSLQMPGNAALFAVLCGIALHRSPDRRAARAH